MDVHATHTLYKTDDPTLPQWEKDYVAQGVPICSVCKRGGWQLATPCPGEPRSYPVEEVLEMTSAKLRAAAKEETNRIADEVVWHFARHGGNDSIEDLAAAYLHAFRYCPASVFDELGRRLKAKLREDGYKRSSRRWVGPTIVLDK